MENSIFNPEVGHDTFSTQYPWWSILDHEVLLTICQRIQPKSVLEFGSGVSTLTFLEAGAVWIDTFEEDESWYDFTHPMLRPYAQIRHLLYRHCNPLFLPTVQVPKYDLAFVDGPRWWYDREPELIYARDHCAVIVVHDFNYPEIQTMVKKNFCDGTYLAEEFETDPGETIGLIIRD